MIKTRTYSQDAYDKFTENEKSASLKYHGGTYGGGSEVLVISYIPKRSEHSATTITKEQGNSMSDKGSW